LSFSASVVLDATPLRAASHQRAHDEHPPTACFFRDAHPLFVFFPLRQLQANPSSTSTMREVISIHIGQAGVATT